MSYFADTIADALEAGESFTIKLAGTAPAPAWWVNPRKDQARMSPLRDCLEFANDAGDLYVIPTDSILFVMIRPTP